MSNSQRQAGLCLACTAAEITAAFGPGSWPTKSPQYDDADRNKERTSSSSCLMQVCITVSVSTPFLQGETRCARQA